MAIGDITRIVFRCQLGFQGGLMVRHYRHSAVGGAGLNHQQIADSFFAGARLFLPQLLTTQATFNFCTAQKIEPTPASNTFQSTALADPGSGGATPLPPQVSGVIKLFTNNAGRRNRGRTYVPFPSEERNDNGLPTAQYITDLQIFGNFLDDTRVVTIGLDSETFVPVIYRRLFTPRTIDIQGTNARSGWGTQRRRGAFGQKNILL